jgi:histidyl-tRNA synthetase
MLSSSHRHRDASAQHVRTQSVAARSSAGRSRTARRPRAKPNHHRKSRQAKDRLQEAIVLPGIEARATAHHRSPDQIAVAPISKQQAGYGAAVLAAFEDAGIRAVAYDSTDTLSRRIVSAHEMAVPVLAVVGAREMRDGRVTLRERDGSQLNVTLADAVSRLRARTAPS